VVFEPARLIVPERLRTSFPNRGKQSSPGDRFEGLSAGSRVSLRRRAVLGRRPLRPSRRPPLRYARRRRQWRARRGGARARNEPRGAAPGGGSRARNEPTEAGAYARERGRCGGRNRERGGVGPAIVFAVAVVPTSSIPDPRGRWCADPSRNAWRGEGLRRGARRDGQECGTAAGAAPDRLRTRRAADISGLVRRAAGSRENGRRGPSADGGPRESAARCTMLCLCCAGGDPTGGAGGDSIPEGFHLRGPWRREPPTLIFFPSLIEPMMRGRLLILPRNEWNTLTMRSGAGRGSIPV